MIQTGEGTDLVLGNSGFVGRLKKQKQRKAKLDTKGLVGCVSLGTGFVDNTFCKVIQRTSLKVREQLWRSALVFMGDALISQQ